MERREFAALALAAGLTAAADTEAAYRLRRVLDTGIATLHRDAGLARDILPWTVVVGPRPRGARS